MKESETRNRLDQINGLVNTIIKRGGKHGR